ncbi:hypothetical protein CLV84_3719 [Neolewinella xylanilytica]|uniref:Uncharacterized protein n=1 Tax=Neolewinella xylanilytica TaxID=1514080 RepID=A0A2S6I0Q5_9BACT|nr:hypothetical protein [Neolewinella xylanilytica]PPK84557.1 hypothetical protein CLV84_3719 [Neolewinella xylanilytica]
MANEWWGTLSIYDHREPVFLKSLILFDRLVIPLPDHPLGNQTSEELDRLHADAAYLASHEAAVIYPWKTEAFQEWQTDFLREALAVGKTDTSYDTRLLLQQRTEALRPAGTNAITAVPVYGARADYRKAYTQLTEVDDQTAMIEIAQLLSVPDGPVPLEAIVRLRERESFRSALRAFRSWQTDRLPELLGDAPVRNANLIREEFEYLLGRYEEELGNGRFDRKKIAVTTVLGLGAVVAAALGEPGVGAGLLGGTASHLFSLRQCLRPAWKAVRDRPCEAAGVIFEGNTLV